MTIGKSAIRKFMEKVELYEGVGGVIVPGDIFFEEGNIKIIYIAYMGTKKMRRRIIDTPKKKGIGKTSVLPLNKDYHLSSKNPPLQVLSSLKMGQRFIYQGPHHPVGKVHKISNTANWIIEMLHSKQRYISTRKSTMVIPL